MDNYISEEKIYEIVNANKGYWSVVDLGEGMELVCQKNVVDYPRVILNHNKKTAFVLNNNVTDFKSLETLKDSTLTMESFEWLPRNGLLGYVVPALYATSRWRIGKYQNGVAEVSRYMPDFSFLFIGFIDKEGKVIVKNSKHMNDVNEIQSMRKKAEEIVAKRKELVLINDDSKKDLATVLVGAALLYGISKLFGFSGGESSSSSGKRCLSRYIIENIVNRCFRDLDEVDMCKMAAYYVMPDLFLGKVKDEIYNEMMFDRINEINSSIFSLKNSYEGHYPNHGTNEIYSLISFMKKDCYEEIKLTKFFSNLKGNFIERMPGLGLVGKAMNGRTEYQILNSINKGLVAYFTYLFVFGSSIDEAKNAFRKEYISNFNDYAFS